MDLNRATRAAPAHSKSTPDPHGISYLQKLAVLEDPDFLERCVEVGMELLAQVKAGLEEPLPAGDTSAPEWLRKIERCQQEYQAPRTIIGVVGNTGAGKSSVINAVLDEERYVDVRASPAPIAQEYNSVSGIHPII